ncbi:hypothetical protein ACETUS_30805, partial [Priestia megaterium]
PGELHPARAAGGGGAARGVGPGAPGAGSGRPAGGSGPQGQGRLEAEAGAGGLRLHGRRDRQASSPDLRGPAAADAAGAGGG